MVPLTRKTCRYRFRDFFNLFLAATEMQNATFIYLFIYLKTEPALLFKHCIQLYSRKQYFFFKSSYMVHVIDQKDSHATVKKSRFMKLSSRSGGKKNMWYTNII